MRHHPPDAQDDDFAAVRQRLAADHLLHRVEQAQVQGCAAKIFAMTCSLCCALPKITWLCSLAGKISRGRPRIAHGILHDVTVFNQIKFNRHLMTYVL